jgi:hypothetical protein
VYIKDFDIVRKDREGRSGGGVAIIVKNGLKYQRMKNLYNCEGKLEVCAISIYINKVKTLLAVGYRPPDKHISGESWTKFFNKFAGNYLIVGDFNAHHPFWGNQDACMEGRKLFNAIENSELGILNSNQMTYRSKHYNTETAIDLAFADYELLSAYK